MVLTVMEAPTFPIILLSKALFPGGLPSKRSLPEQADTLAHYPWLQQITLVLISSLNSLKVEHIEQINVEVGRSTAISPC